MRRQRAIVDDAASLRILSLHQPKRPARAQERTRQIDGDDLIPLVHGELIEWSGRRRQAGIVEQKVQPPESIPDGFI